MWIRLQLYGYVSDQSIDTVQALRVAEAEEHDVTEVPRMRLQIPSSAHSAAEGAHSAAEFAKPEVMVGAVFPLFEPRKRAKSAAVNPRASAIWLVKTADGSHVFSRYDGENGKPRVRCNVAKCTASFAQNGGSTTNLWDHLEISHKALVNSC